MTANTSDGVSAPSPTDAAATDHGAKRAGGGVIAGLILMTAAMLILPVIDAVAKWVGSEGMAPLQISFARFVVQVGLLLPIALAVLGWRRLLPKRLGLALLRGVLIAVATVLFFTALQHMQITETIAIFFVEPLILTLLSAVFLGERIGWRRVVAVILGFVGAMLIVQPNFLILGWVAALPLAAALCFAVYLLLTKALTKIEHPLVMHLWAGLGGGGLLGGMLILGAAAEIPAIAPIWPTADQLMLLGLLGLVATAGHFLIVLAFKRAPASLLAPLQYLEILSGTLLGYVIFGDFPNAITWVGVALIVGSGLFVFWRQRLRGAAEA